MPNPIYHLYSIKQDETPATYILQADSPDDPAIWVSGVLSEDQLRQALDEVGATEDAFALAKTSQIGALFGRSAMKDLKLTQDQVRELGMEPQGPDC